jgi:hypothetical protein
MGLLTGLLDDGDGENSSSLPALNIQNLTAATDTISKNPFIELRATSALTMTSTPTISAGLTDGERIIIRGSDNTNTITLQSESNLAGSNLYMEGGFNCVLGQNDWIQFRWNAITSTWDELTRSLNS